MRLKKISLRGFKSFADHTALEFDKGITAIVGPNGCGKSNVVDAFRWVLGEQSAKSLRGAKMHDVLFAGTTKRRALNTVEVTITLDNVAGSLPTPFEEVAITRRLHRNGTSEYLINGHDVRLRDIQALFLDSGIGKEAFSIFEQGKIEQVIHWSPLERRVLFEEAAGIVRFLHRKREALQKLEQAEQNLARVVDIHSEVLERLTTLEQQAVVARRYKEIKATLEQLEYAIALSKWRQGHAKEEALQQTQQQLEERQQQAQVKQQQAREGCQQQQTTVGTAEEELRRRQGELQGLRSDRAVRERDRSHSSQRRQELLTQRQQWEKELTAATERRATYQEEKRQLLNQHQQLQSTVQDKRKAAEQARDNTQAIHRHVEELRREQQQRHKARLASLEKHSQLESELKKIEERLSSHKEQLEQLVPRRQESLKQEQHASTNATAKSDELAIVSKEVEAKKNSLEALEKQLIHCKSQLEAHRKQDEEVRRREAEVLARLKALEELRAAMEGLSEGCRRLLQAAKNPKNGLYAKVKPFYELFNPAKASKASLAALQRYTHTLVVEKRSDIQEVLDWAKKQRCGDISLVCLETMPPGFCSEAFCSHLVIASDLDQLLLQRQAGQEGWCEAQELLVDSHGVIFQWQHTEGNVFSREVAIQTLQEQAKELSLQKQSAHKQLTSIQEKHTSLQSERTLLDKAMRSQEMKLVEVNHALLRWQEEQRRCQGEQQQIGRDEERLQKAIIELQERCATAAALCQASSSELQAAAHTSGSQEQHLDAEVTRLKQVQKNQEDSEREARAAVAQERQCFHALEVTDVKLQEAHQRLDQLQSDLTRSNTALDALEQQTTSSEQFLNELHVKITELENVCQTCDGEVASAKKLLADKQSEAKRIEAESKATDQELHKLALQMSQLAASQEALTNTFYDRYEQDLSTACQNHNASCDDIPASERRCRQLRQELEGCGDVNLAAIEECERDKERSTFLATQLQDLKAAKEQLLHIIEDLDSQSRQRFQTTFEAIRTNFHKNFALLFPGGEADLQLVEGSDLLSAGIEITARPAGKQTRTLTLLSGGEKSLTAMALLFAIFEVKPAPYCILDEIDAPLDDTNVDRLAAVIQQFADRCQFILVTHNKNTMSIAQRIYGVSMQEKGVSKLLAMDFSTSEEPVAQLAHV